MNIDTSPLPSRITSGSDVVMSTTLQQQQQKWQQWQQQQQQQQRHIAVGGSLAPAQALLNYG
jgi:hypothetical protein